MSKCQYIIEGNLYGTELDFKSSTISLAAKFDILAEVEKTKKGYLVSIETQEDKILSFEPLLFKKLSSLMEVKLYAKKESEITNNIVKKFKISAQFLRQEEIIAIQGKNSFHLVCNASKAKAVLALRDLISQPDKPLSVMYKNIQKARQLVLLSSKEEALLISDSKPFVISKLRTLHRLEKVKYKHKLTPLINTLNQRITLSLAHNDLYEKLFEEVDFPLVSIDVDTIDRDKIKYVLESDGMIQKPYKREILQIVYGKTQSIEPKIEIKEKLFEVCLDYEKSCIGDFKFKTFDFNKREEKSVIHLYNYIAMQSGELQKNSFINQSIMLAEDKHEACEEHLFDFEIIDNEIEIDIDLKNSKLNYLSSTLTNTIATIITQIAKKQELDVHLSGELFHYKNLSELTIEKLEDEDIKVILS